MMRYSLSQYEHRGEGWKTFRIATLLCVVALLSMLIVEQAWSAKPPGGHLNITEVAVDNDLDTITITGTDLDFGPGPLVVILGDVDTGPGDITTECTGIPATATMIVCDLSGSGGLPMPGDYLLTVSQGNGQSQGDEYDLTIASPPLATLFIIVGDANPHEIITNTVKCPDGKKVTGGGCLCKQNSNGPDGRNDCATLVGSRPTENNGDDCGTLIFPEDTCTAWTCTCSNQCDPLLPPPDGVNPAVNIQTKATVLCE